MARQLNNRGLDANRKGNYVAARKMFLHAKQLDGTDPRYGLSAANMLLRLDDAEGAAREYEEILADPQHKLIDR